MKTESKTQDYNGCPDTCIKKKNTTFFINMTKEWGPYFKGSTVAKTFPIP